MEIQIGKIYGGRGGDFYCIEDTIEIDITKSTQDVYDQLSEEDAEPNMQEDVISIVANLELNKICTCLDSFGEGVIVYAPITTPLNEMKLAAYEEFNNSSED